MFLSIYTYYWYCDIKHINVYNLGKANQLFIEESSIKKRCKVGTRPHKINLHC